MRANTPRHSRDPAHTCLEELPVVRLATLFNCLDSNPHSSVDLPAKENRKPPVTAPEVSPPVQRLLASKKTVGLARWRASLVTSQFVAWLVGGGLAGGCK
jgi:hypothetical protein